MHVPYIQIADGEELQKLKIKGNKLTIGRHADNDVAIKDHKASRFHAQVLRTSDGWMLRDLNSSNGTRLNGARIQEGPIKSGDLIEIGSTRLQFMDPQGAVVDSPIASTSPPPTAHGVAAPTPPIQAQTAAPSPPSSRGENFDIDAKLPPEDRLVRIASSLSPGFFAFDIVILNARGQISLPPPVGRKPPKDSGEPQLLLRLLLLVCAGCGASDIHVEPHEKDTLVRLRVDGNMVDACTLEPQLGVRLLSMIKVLCDLDIAQKSVVQESHFSARLPRTGATPAAENAELRRVDYRVSFAPSVHGQKLVVRIQDNVQAPARIDDLLMPPWMHEDLGGRIRQDSGMILVCGPTGSGKTTTLYALLRTLDSGQRNVVTIENPVEIQIPGITQLPVDEPQGKTFSALLKSVLRQDPDIILVGEIRDEETARTAMQAAITGHLVFSTLHTKDTFGTVYRLLDLGIEPFLLSQALSTVLAQRLVRKLCLNCKRPAKPTPEQARMLASVRLEVRQLFEPAGCEKCFRTGYAGRRAIFELLSVNEAMREAIAHNKTTSEVAVAAAGEHFIKLLHAGYQLVADGTSSFDDVERVVGR